MGQLKTVQVHGLLKHDSIDERILEFLEAKTAVPALIWSRNSVLQRGVSRE
jgi:SNF2 family DNA or RNA helicase